MKMETHHFAMAMVLVATCTVLGVGANDYCKLDTCPNGSHTMCKYKTDEPSKNCEKYKRYGLLDEEKKLLLDKHNELRARVGSGSEKRGKPGPQPAARLMKNLKWDDELANIGQRWANQCNFQHDQCRNVERFLVGQNVAKRSATGKRNVALEEMIEMWYDEVEHFDRRQVSKFKSSAKVGHYTQLVWAESEYLGCGLVEYLTPDADADADADGWTHVLLVCNYGPAGNILGRAIYQTK